MVDSLNRLMALHDLLLNLPEDRFSMSNWRRGDVECGMVCCLGGWATTICDELEFRKDPLGGYHIVNTEQPDEAFSVLAFANAFGLGLDAALDLTVSSAPHQTPKAAAAAVLLVAEEVAEKAGVELGVCV